MPWSPPVAEPISITPLDKTLSADLLEMLNACIPAMSKSHQDALVAFLKGQAPPTSAQEALGTLWTHSPAMNARLQTESGGQAMDLAILSPSLLAWTMGQPWADTIDMKQLMTKWTGFIVTKPPNSEEVRIPRACIYLNRFLPLIPSIQEPQRSSIVGYLYNELKWLTSNDESHPQLGELMGAMGFLASHQVVPSDYVPLSDQWLATSEKILYARNRSKAERTAIGLGLVQSALPDKLKAQVLAFCPGKVWSLPAASVLLLPTFPVDEFDRFEQLPWCHEGDEQSEADNRAMLAAYCPRIASLVALLAKEEDWRDYDAMHGWVQQCRSQDIASVETLELPLDL